jgi:hypothetical protein
MLESRFWLRVNSFSGLLFPGCDLSTMDDFIFTHFLNENTVFALPGKMQKTREISLKIGVFLKEMCEFG